MTASALLAVLLTAAALLPWSWTRRPRRPGSRRRARPVTARDGRVDQAVVLDLLRSALTAGAGVPRAISAVASAMPDKQGEALHHVVTALQLGADWDEAWRHAPAEHQILRRTLQPAWTGGVSPVPLLQQGADSIRRTRLRRAREAAARLGVRLVLPLGLCLLPAFVLFGLLPVLLSTGGRLLGF